MASRHPEDEQPPKAHTIAKAIFCSIAVDTYQTVAADQRSTRPERISTTEAALTAKLRLTRHPAIPALAAHLRPRIKRPRATNSPDARPKAKPRTDSSRRDALQRHRLNSTDARSDPPPLANNATANYGCRKRPLPNSSNLPPTTTGANNAGPYGVANSGGIDPQPRKKPKPTPPSNQLPNNDDDHNRPSNRTAAQQRPTHSTATLTRDHPTPTRTRECVDAKTCRR